MQRFLDTARPSWISQAWLLNLLAATGGLALMMATTEVRFYLPLSPVPISLHPLTVFLIGAVLGKKRGLMAVVPYALLKASPLAPNAGYFLGMIPSVYIVGLALEAGWLRSYRRTLLAMATAELAVLLPGALWLGAYIGMNQVLQTGIMLYLPGDLCKIFLAAALVPSATRLFGKSR